MSQEKKLVPNFTQTPNVFFDEWLNELSSTEVHVLCAIIRKTYGWRKEEDRISFSQLKKLTGLALSTIQNAIKKLIEREIIIQRIVEGICSYSFAIETPICKRDKEISTIPNSGNDVVQNNSYIPGNGTEVYRMPVTPPYRETVSQKERLEITKKTASTRAEGAVSLQKISFDKESGEFVGIDEFIPFFESKYKERFESMQRCIDDVYFEACEVAKKIELKNAGAFLDSFFRDRAFPWIRNEAKKRHERTLSEEIISQAKTNYDFYCSVPFLKNIEFRDLHVKIKNTDFECYVYANPEFFREFIYKAMSI